jgi:hypothetical protein
MAIGKEYGWTDGLATAGRGGYFFLAGLVGFGLGACGVGGVFSIRRSTSASPGAGGNCFGFTSRMAGA